MPNSGGDSAPTDSDAGALTDTPHLRGPAEERVHRALEVYWRPGCPFCSRLLGALVDAKANIELRNIWEDDDARDFVRKHNGGNETVPTIAIGDLVLTNPAPREFVELLSRDYPDLLPAPAELADHAEHLEDPAGR
jgi:glutaredoxin